MKLYYMKGACSLASHIALIKAGASFELVQVDFANKKAADGRDFNQVNPKGYVPALTLDDGQTLTENVCVLQYIADLKPAAKLAPPYGTMERYRLIEWLAFISSEIHKSYSPLFRHDASEEARNYARAHLSKRLEYLNGALAGREFVAGQGFSIADCYLGVVLGWSGHVKLDLGKWPEVSRYLQGFQAQPQVIAAQKAEGLIK
jgi:glutathione S-transferase